MKIKRLHFILNDCHSPVDGNVNPTFVAEKVSLRA